MKSGTPLRDVISGLNRWLEQGVSKDAEVFVVPADALGSGLVVRTDKDIAMIEVEQARGHDEGVAHTVLPGSSWCFYCGREVSELKPGSVYKVPMIPDGEEWFAVLPGGGATPIKMPEFSASGKNGPRPPVGSCYRQRGDAICGLPRGHEGNCSWELEEGL